MRVFTVKVTNTGSIPMSLDFNNVDSESKELIDGISGINKIDTGNDGNKRKFITTDKLPFIQSTE